ncbi:putative ankyrin repeat-containing domain, PGG domain, ankyrin repeat-containing domain superfamily [Helianthus debilis subsp. tardiflorus]
MDSYASSPDQSEEEMIDETSPTGSQLAQQQKEKTFSRCSSWVGIQNSTVGGNTPPLHPTRETSSRPPSFTKVAYIVPSVSCGSQRNHSSIGWAQGYECRAPQFTTIAWAQHSDIPQYPAIDTRKKPKLPKLPTNSVAKDTYSKIRVRLFESSMKCDWDAAKAIFDQHPDWVRCSIAKEGETALHFASSKKQSKHVENFVKNLVDMMEPGDLELETVSFSTALYTAAVAGNIETVKIMVEKNENLLTIMGGNADAKLRMMPLHAAALVGNHEVVKYLYENSNDLNGENWDDKTRSWLLEKCVEGDMFDVALDIVSKYPAHGNTQVLKILAGKPDAFSERKSNYIKRRMHSDYTKCIEENAEVPESSAGKPDALSKRISNYIKRRMHSGNAKVPESSSGKPDALSERKSNYIKRRMHSAFALIGLAGEAYEETSKALQVLQKIWEHIAEERKTDIDDILRGPLDSQNLSQLLPIQKLIYKHLVNLHEQTKPKEMTSPQENTYTLLDELFQKHLKDIIDDIKNFTEKDNITIPRRGGRTIEFQKLINEHIVNIYDEIENIKVLPDAAADEPVDECQGLQKLIFKHITEMYALLGLNREKYSSRIPFIAAERGNTNFLVELIHRYPDLICKLNDDKQTIFHIAVKYRHEGIYNLLYEIGSMKDFVIRREDIDENNMLHLVGKRATKERLAVVSGPALQMQRELLWFKEVRNMMHPDLRERKNKDGLTPRELFTREHKELIKEGEEWIKGVASQCMVVAALIATIVFAAAFTVPGGYNQNDGIPIFYRKSIFLVFVVADAMSLFLSTTSILTFLSILTSRYAERDFVESLPKKLMLGISTLFLSITTMMVTFGVSFFILYHKEMKWIPIVISLFAVTPVLLYVVLQYHLLVDVIRSTYGSKYLFKPEKQVLYYENPKF